MLCPLTILFRIRDDFHGGGKLKDGTHSYNTFVIPCAVEAVKLVASSAMFVRERVTRRKSQTPLAFTIRGFAARLPGVLLFREQQRPAATPAATPRRPPPRNAPPPISDILYQANHAEGQLCETRLTAPRCTNAPTRS